MTFRLLDAQHRLTGYAKIFRDLTVERQFDQELRGSAERYRLAVRAADEALWDRDLNTDTVTWTDGFEEVFGYGPAAVGRDIRWWEQRIHQEDRARVRESLRRAIGAGHERWEEEYRFRRCDGEYVLVHDRALIMRSTDGLPLRMLGAMVDVGRQQRSRDALRQSQRLEALGRLAGGVAHDLNNMLMSIIGFTEILDQGFPAGDPRRRHTAEVLASANRSAALTRKLLAFARREVTRPLDLDANELVARSTAPLRNALGREIELRLDLARELPLVHADPAQVEQILLDLALNARDAMPDGGRLTIATREERFEDAEIRARYPGIGIPPGRYVVIQAADSGTGMSPDVLERAFEPFFTTKPLGKGLGLGLAAVYGAVKQNNGYIWAKSEVGQGSQFEVLLPVGNGRGSQESL
jgi:PAS domain S-box-containing protein